ncbi:PD-(D/E)XK nuclease family transposase [[Clostridium] innocuum]|uniref:PD-(D/E)XK nuclease family transposase n=1 Tax=Clostridium innocuum TaxID=1522 RepID=UPI003A598EA6
MEDMKMSNQLNYSNDLFFKYTLSREDEGSVYARNTIIQRATGIRVKESTVLNPNPGIIGKKRIILDVHVKDEMNRHFNIEMQTTYKGIAEMMRFEFYGARALNNQLNSGKKYKDLKPVYQIIFIDEYAWNNRNLINHYQMRNEQGENESYYPLILRTYIHMPAINDIVKEKELQRLNDFEQLVYLFENNEKNDILKSKERLVKVFVDKYEEMQKDDELWSTAMAIQMGEARYRYGLEDSFEEGKKKGEELLLIKQLESKYHEDCSAWLQSLSNEQIEAVSSLILVCNSFQELKDQVMSMK